MVKGYRWKGRWREVIIKWMVKGIGERGGWRGIGDMVHLGEKGIVGPFFSLYYLLCFIWFWLVGVLWGIVEY